MFNFDFDKFNVFIINNDISSLILQHKKESLVYLINTQEKELNLKFMNGGEFDNFLNMISLRNNIKRII